MTGIGTIVEVLDNGRVHVSMGRESVRDLIVVYPMGLRVAIEKGVLVLVFEPEGSSTERYGLPVARYNGEFSDGPGDLVAQQAQIDYLHERLEGHAHPSHGSPPTPVPTEPPPGAQKVRAE